MIHKKIAVDDTTYEHIKNLLINREIDLEGVKISLNPSQDISFNSDRCVFIPPLDISINVVGLNIKTTISYIQITNSGLHVEIDHSPVDLKVIPK